VPRVIAGAAGARSGNTLKDLTDRSSFFTVSLQKDVRSDDAAVLKERNDVLHFGDALKVFSDTAALMVISVDTSVAHLASALGEPVWILCPNDFDHLCARDYPTRQGRFWVTEITRHKPQ
jgi:hypothetical protein